MCDIFGNVFGITMEEVRFMKNLTTDIVEGPLDDARGKELEAEFDMYAKRQAANIDVEDIEDKEASAALLMMRSHMIAILGTLPEDHEAFKRLGIEK